MVLKKASYTMTSVEALILIVLELSIAYTGLTLYFIYREEKMNKKFNQNQIKSNEK